MKVTELNEELIKEIESTSLYLIRAINSYRKNKKHKFTHKKIGASMSTPISQSTVSKMLMESNVDDSDDPYGNLSISEAKELCAAMGTTLGNVLLEYEQQFAQDSGGYDKDNSQEYSVKKTTTNIPEQCYNIPGRETTIYPACLFSENDSLTNDISDPMFKPWFGKYYCYFYSTMSDETDCFEGELDIPEAPGSGCCYVRFGFVYNQTENLRKEYYGQLVLSKKQNGGAYCTLINHDDQGEITYLVMANPAVNNSQVCCVVAFVATISAGKDTKRPCVERMIISREPLDGNGFEMAKAHLLLNDKHIRITEENFCRLLEHKDLPVSFKKRFVAYKEHPFDAPFLADYIPKTANIPETWVKSLAGYSDREHQMIIDLIRIFSEAPKYNKIRQKTSETDIYKLFSHKYKSRSSTVKKSK